MNLNNKIIKQAIYDGKLRVINYNIEIDKVVLTLQFIYDPFDLVSHAEEFLKTKIIPYCEVRRIQRLIRHSYINGVVIYTEVYTLEYTEQKQMNRKSKIDNFFALK